VKTLMVHLVIILGLCSVPHFLHGVENRIQLYYDGTNTCVYLYGRAQSHDSFRENLKRIGERSTTIGFNVLVCHEVPFKDVIHCIALMQNAGVTNLVIEMRMWGESPVTSQVRLGLLPRRIDRIVYQGSSLKTVPEDP